MELLVRINFIKSSYYLTFVSVDFNLLKIRFKPSGATRDETDSFVKEKDLSFSDVLEVKLLDLDFAKGEHWNVKDVPFRAKFLLRTRKRDYALFAKDGQERQLWVDALQQVLP